MISRQTPGHGVSVDVDITGAKKLFLVVDDGGDNVVADHFNWSEPRMVGPQGEMKLTDLKWAGATAGWGQPSTTVAAGGQEMASNGQKVAYGIGTHAQSVIEFDLPPGYTRFKSFAGLDDGGTHQPNGATVHALVFTRSPIAENGLSTVPVSLRELSFPGAI